MFTKSKVTQSMVDAVNEALKGDQHKIDANKNKKIDAQDFEILRSKKEVKEELKGDQHTIRLMHTILKFSVNRKKKLMVKKQLLESSKLLI
jgi:hypothetical protein